ncbi:sensor histidine kinase [Selenihalanaerobacter shriftii]|uniref:histidine kinase n=1 Tax=Selenihalanaerobacter shriftii TaxID=142842 RepID=A0A1T4LA92_9FIRM|nr:ATP-binding protein [Selenihalanaerobacter shriftii]SJZ51501.1 Histidine kinase-, DNA gyrase B-, and HSP90-like ATPase [Selenihalanaerobacter shriftii]
MDEDPIIYSLLVSKSAEARSLDVDLMVDLNVSLRKANLPSHKLIRIISNLIDNALDELANNQSLENNRIKINSDVVGEQIKIVVHNNYSVIPKGLQKQIFKLGFSTKHGNKEDRGFGLYITQKIIKRYGGSIEILSNSKVGTKLIIKLPKSSE